VSVLLIPLSLFLGWSLLTPLSDKNFLNIFSGSVLLLCGFYLFYMVYKNIIFLMKEVKNIFHNFSSKSMK
jgi:hypothetical protein